MTGPEQPGRGPAETAVVPFANPAEASPGAPAWRRGLRVVRVLAVVTGLLLVAVVAAGLLVSELLGGNVERIPGVFAGLDEAVRPPAGAELTFLLVGTDTRSAEPTTGSGAEEPAFVPGRQRSDVIMVVRVDSERTGATVVSIPRDSYVDIPGNGRNKINAAYSIGGPGLLVQAVERLTSVRIDHFAVIDFAGFKDVIDSVGGIDVAVAQATSNVGVDFHQGVNHLDGTQALAYVRQRHGLPEGDLDRNQRHQAVLRAVLGKVTAGLALADPSALYELLDALSRSVGVDDTLSNGGLRGLAFDLRTLRPGAITYLRAPVAGFGTENGASVVHLDGERGAELWTAVRDGRAAAYADRHPQDTLEPAPA